jgi:hypothetical protein
VKDNTCLGTILTNKNQLKPEIEKRITDATSTEVFRAINK